MTSSPRQYWMHGFGTNYYVDGDIFLNCTSGRIAANWGNSAGINIERNSIYEDNFALNRGILYCRAWMVGKYINITFI